MANKELLSEFFGHGPWADRSATLSFIDKDKYELLKCVKGKIKDTMFFNHELIAELYAEDWIKGINPTTIRME